MKRLGWLPLVLALGCSSPSPPAGPGDTGTGDTGAPTDTGTRPTKDGGSHKDSAPPRDSGHDVTTVKDAGHGGGDAGHGGGDAGTDGGAFTCVFDQAGSIFDQACAFGN